MKAQYVFENMRFERGQDPKSSMGIGKRALIKKWFDDLDISPDEYTIDDKLNIFLGGSLYLSNTKITSLPDNLSVERSLDLENSQITSLPDNLSVGGYLDLANTKITSLPDNLSVGGEIYKDF